MLAPWNKSYDKSRQNIKKQRHYFSNKFPSNKSYGFSTSLVRTWELDHKESWALKNWCFWTVVLEKILLVFMDCKESNQSILKEISPEYSLEGLMLQLQLQYFGRLMWRTDPFEKTLMLGKIEGRRRRGWQRLRWLDGMNLSNGHEFKQTLGDDEGQGSLVWCHPWGYKESDKTVTELNWTDR